MPFRRSELSGILGVVVNPTRIEGLGILLDDWIVGSSLNIGVQMPGSIDWVVATCSGTYSLAVGTSVYLYEFPGGSYEFEFPAAPGSDVTPIQIAGISSLLEEWIPGVSTFINVQRADTLAIVKARPSEGFTEIPFQLSFQVYLFSFNDVIYVFQPIPVGDPEPPPDSLSIPILEEMLLPGVRYAEQLRDFGDGRGLVAAVRHTNPDGTIGGWIENTSNIRVDNTVTLRDDVEVFGYAQLYGYPVLSGRVKVYGNASVHGHAVVSGDVWLSGSADVDDAADLSERCWVQGTVKGTGIVRGDAQFLAGVVASGGVVEGNAIVQVADAVIDYVLGGNARLL